MIRTLRRLFRFALSGLCLLSLLASVGAGWLWGRSYRTRTAAEFPWAGGRWEVALHRGRVGADNEPQRRLERERASERGRPGQMMRERRRGSAIYGIQMLGVPFS